MDVARAVGLSHVHVSRIERGDAPGVGFRTLATIASVLGLKVWVRVFPAGRRLLDAPQLRLFALFRQRVGDRWSWRTEVPVPIAGDLRAADAVGHNGSCTLQVEVITRLADFQAQTRSARLKMRDLRADRRVLVVAGSRANRQALREADDALRSSFPMGTRHVLQALAQGLDPGADGIVLL